jgi:hypothetical protein
MSIACKVFLMPLSNIRPFVSKKLPLSLLLMTVWFSPVLADEHVTFYFTRADHLYYSGLVLRRVENPAQEIGELTSVLSKDPKNVKAYYNRGIIKRQNGDPTGAKEDFFKAVSQWPITPEEYADSCLIKVDG